MPTAARVSANEGVVLGMLAGGPGSGYDLLRRIRRSVGYFWTPARSHVYSLLPALADAGLGRVRQVAPAARGDRGAHRERRERIGIELAELEALERTIDRDASPFGFDYAA
jgi:PadR family transcriptional regulator, regulatory protein AphA